ncbi:hypothetical protein [Fusobacterium russii]|uniref:hypothetical protein n=1 Tax=Fusobacterium russii TaxID=854 RepID=UPI00039E4C6A|nr:hypothetical protein [Fusobacterium russii]
MLKKVLLIAIFISIFSSCSVISKNYDYIPNIRMNELSVVTFLKDERNEFSPVEVIRIRDRRSDGKNRKHKLKLLNDKIKIVYNGKEHTLIYKNEKNYDDIYIYI